MDYRQKYHKYKQKYKILKGGDSSNKLLILGICGSAKRRSESKNMLLLKYCEKVFKKRNNVNFKIIDITKLPCSNNDIPDSHKMYDHRQDPPTKEIKDMIDLYNKCDGILFATATHNWGITATLKNFIDWMPIYKSNRLNHVLLLEQVVDI